MSLLYYEKAPVMPSEALDEKFYSLGGFVYDNRIYKLDNQHFTCITMKNLTYKLENQQSTED